MQLQAIFHFKGTRMVAPPEWVSLALTSRYVVTRFAAKPVVRLRLDDAAPIAVPLVDRVARTVEDGEEEIVAARLPRALFLRLAGATRAVIEVDTVVLPLDEPHLEALRDLASRMSPAGYRAALAERAIVSARDSLGFTLRKEVRDARDVDSAAKPLGPFARPRWPNGVVRVTRAVNVEYVVDTTGAVELASLHGEAVPGDSVFVASIREAARSWRFRPAYLDGRPVRQRVRNAIPFDSRFP